MQEKTTIFSVNDETKLSIRKELIEIASALEEKGYNAIDQIIGYILSEDPTYITTNKNARSRIRKIDRDELLHELLEYYLK